eukprot:NODE_2931_length_1061_cov_59.490364_g2797_i0.p1 GENE.NODE_2931_length_1061_cov_59.490364_g2797_i0~~NODE_2931_length_1061_cov_59.490364_g2797_i0.p1  ORF type:complete len:326 (+),score=81.95 NODE_2931_length_1061_cov_59.490364_g2797_i0:3-980(+)
MGHFLSVYFFSIPSFLLMSAKISDVLDQKPTAELSVSFEYFPPKTAKGVENLYNRIELMGKASPKFIDFTWGAGGGTSDLTLELCKTSQTSYGLVSNMHLTCTNMDAKKIDIALQGCVEAGISNVVALRGDPPQGTSEWTAMETGFSCALDLVRHINKQYPGKFCLSVAGYPEGHPDTIAEDGLCPADKFKSEVAYLKQKIDAGASLVITQLFYDVPTFLKFFAACREAGITVPILPGLLPVQTYSGFIKIIGFCKTFVPEEMKQRMEAIKDDEAAVKAYGVEQATEMCKQLIAAGHLHLHFYCMNSEVAVFQIMENLGIPTKAE